MVLLKSILKEFFLNLSRKFAIVLLVQNNLLST